MMTRASLLTELPMCKKISEEMESSGHFLGHWRKTHLLVFHLFLCELAHFFFAMVTRLPKIQLKADYSRFDVLPFLSWHRHQQHLPSMPIRKDEDLLRTSGWLHIRSRTLGIQKRHYFRIGAQAISCHRSESSRASWRLNIFNANVDGDAEMRRITIHTNKREVTLFAAHEAEFNHWLYYIQQTASRSIEQRYEFRQVIGRGALGSVFRGHESMTGTSVAIKHIPKQGSAEDKRALQEVYLLRDLGHRNIVPTLGVYETVDTVYIVMEHVRGGNLHEVVRGMGGVTAVSEELTRGVIKDILFGLVYLHDRGIVHRDLKFGNVLCEREVLPCRVKIADFGLAGSVSGGLKSRVGSAYFVAPEVACGERYGVNVDCWSVGVMMYILLIGRHPFYGVTTSEVLRSVVRGRVTVGGCGWEGVSEMGISLLRGLLERDSGKRLGAREALQHDWFHEM